MCPPSVSVLNPRPVMRNLYQLIKDAPCINIYALKDYLDMSIRPFVQPIIKASTGKIAGLEVLLRFRDNHGAFHSPEPIIETLESSNVINDITKTLMDDVIYNFYPFIQQIPAPLFLTFNVNAQQLSSPQIKQAALNFNALFSQRLTLYLEIVERSSGESIEKVKNTMATLKESGIHFAIDDLGCGSSRLKYLETQDFDLIKMDKALAQAEQGRLIYKNTLAAMVNLSRELGIKLVVEGVETSEQADLLKQCGIDLLQGFYYARPMPISQFLITLRQ